MCCCFLGCFGDDEFVDTQELIEMEVLENESVQFVRLHWWKLVQKINKYDIVIFHVLIDVNENRESMEYYRRELYR